jgi:CheY-like chemotaxis protein
VNQAGTGHGSAGASDGSSAGRAGAGAGPWTILFVDDDTDFLAAQEAFFGSRGHAVHTADSSTDALELLEALTPDIIFLDLMMERYDSGFRLAHQIRKNERLAGVPIVMLSGVARETGQRFDQEGQGLLNWSKLDRFVDKPATGKQLLGIAQEYLGAPDDGNGGHGDHPDGAEHGAGAAKGGAA